MARTCMLKTLNERLDWYDIGLVKWGAVFFVLFIMTAWPSAGEFLLSVPWYLYLGLTALITVPILVKVAMRNGPSKR